MEKIYSFQQEKDSVWNVFYEKWKSENSLEEIRTKINFIKNNYEQLPVEEIKLKIKDIINVGENLDDKFISAFRFYFGKYDAGHIFSRVMKISDFDSNNKEKSINQFLERFDDMGPNPSKNCNSLWRLSNIGESNNYVVPLNLITSMFEAELEVGEYFLSVYYKNKKQVKYAGIHEFFETEYEDLNKEVFCELVMFFFKLSTTDKNVKEKNKIYKITNFLKDILFKIEGDDQVWGYKSTKSTRKDVINLAVPKKAHDNLFSEVDVSILKKINDHEVEFVYSVIKEKKYFIDEKKTSESFEQIYNETILLKDIKSWKN